MRRYEDYLDSIINQNDLFYLGSIDLARRRVEYGCSFSLVLTCYLTCLIMCALACCTNHCLHFAGAGTHPQV